MNIIIRTIPHGDHRPEAGPTVGDWWFDPDGTLQVRVSELPDAGYAFLVGLHEMIEAFMCRWRGLDQEAVDAFDLGYTGDGEPGDHPEAPYREEHAFAEAIERLMAHELGVPWLRYGEVIDDVGK